MIKYDRTKGAFLLENFGAGRGIEDVGQRIPGRWHVIEKMDAHSLFKQQFPSFNTPTKLVFAALSRAGVQPKVYLRGVPDAEGSVDQSIRYPRNLDSFATDIKTVTMEGRPPHSFRVFISGPPTETMEALVKSAHTLWLEHLKNPDVTTLEKVQRVLDAYVKSKVSQQVINDWIDIAIETEGGARPNPHVHTKFKYERIAFNTIGHRYGLASQAPDSAKQSWLRTKDKALKTEVDKLVEAIMGLYYYEIWKAFQEYVFDNTEGVVHTIDNQIKTGKVREAYDKTKGKPVPTTVAIPEKKYDPREPHKNPVLYKHQGYVTSTNPRGPKSKVVASIRQDTGDLGTMLVTAEPKERVSQRSDGSYFRPPTAPRHVGSMVPESSVGSIVDTGDYHAIFGIYYDNPLIVPKLSHQIYWYGNRDHFFRAVFEYAIMTGDTPVLAYRIYPKKGDRANLGITRRELEQNGGPEGRRAVAAIDKTITAFHREIKRGHQLWHAKIAKWLGVEVDLSQNDIPLNPLRDMPEGKNIDPEGWTKYRTWVRNNSRSKLGLNFQAQLSKKYIDPNTGRQKAWKFSRHMDASREGYKTTVRMTGERDKHGKPVEPWAVYLIEYLLAHKTIGMVGDTYMAPINVIRADDDIPPRGTTKRWTKSAYMQLLRENFGRFPVSKATNWKFLRARTSHKFPFSRLIRHSVVPPADLPEVNEKLKQGGLRGITRTEFGYIVDGLEWDAYQMVVAMPPSVAEKEFGLLHRNSYSRLVLDEPRIIRQHRLGKQGPRRSLKEFGFTPFKVKSEFLTSPFSKADQTSVDPASIIGRKTVLPPGYFHSKLGRTWVPKVHTHLNDAGEVAHRTIVDYEKLNDPEDRMKMWETYARRVALQAKEVEYDIRSYLRALSSVEMAVGSRLGADLDANIDTYIKYVRKELTPTGGHYTIPVVVQKLGLAKYTAPIGSVNLQTAWLTVKAPSESVAKFLILYRLLRRSVSNKEMGKAMKIRSRGGSYRIFPDNNARLLAQWAASNFAVVRNDDPGGIRRIGPRINHDQKDLERGVPDAQHLLARLLRID